jgi:energy-coupling factor transport system substrate-specific component
MNTTIPSGAASGAAAGRRRPVLRLRLVPALTLVAASAVGVAGFGWPFLLGPGSVLEHQADAPWMFVLLLGLLGAVVAAELASGGMDAKTVALLGVLAAVGGALRVLGTGTAGIEPMFFLLLLAGRVLGPAAGFLLGGLALLVGAFLTGGIGPWTPFQVFAAGWFTLGAALLPRASGWPERLMLAAYGLVAALAYGAVMNLWFWPFLSSGLPAASLFVPGDPVADNLSRYALFYVATSLGWDLPRGLLTAGLCLVAGRPVGVSLRRGVRRARLGGPPPQPGPPP